MAKTLLPLFVLLPLSALLLIALAGLLARRSAGALAVISSAGTLALSVLALLSVGGHGPLAYAVGGWLPPLGIAMVVDGLSAFMLVTVNLILFLLLVYSPAYLRRFGGSWHYYVFFMLISAGANGALLAGDLFNLFLFTEVTVIAAYALAAYEGSAESFEASFKYAVLGSLSSMFIILGIALVYAHVSTLDLARIARTWPAGTSFVSLLVCILFTAGFGLKATLVPFHAWVPDAYSAAPAPASAAYAGVISKVFGVYMIARLFYNVFGVSAAVLNLFALLGVLSIVTGVTLALYQWDLKRLLAYHSISQIGYIVLGLGLGTPLGVLGGLFHLVNHSLFKPLLFLNAGSIEYATGARNLKEMGGLAKRMPVTGTTSMIASLSISGVPPLNGFWSKLIIVVACIQAGRYWLGVIAALASILTLASFLKVQRYAFYGYVKDTWANAVESPLLMTVPMIVLSLLCTFLGILLLPGFNDGFLGLASRALLAGREYGTTLAGLF